MRTSMLVAVLLGTALSIPSTMALAAKADPVAAANRDTARFVHDATDPYCTTAGKECRRHHHDHWGWDMGWHHHHHDWGWGMWGEHEHHHHMHHHRHHKKAM